MKAVVLAPFAVVLLCCWGVESQAAKRPGGWGGHIRRVILSRRPSLSNRRNPSGGDSGPRLFGQALQGLLVGQSKQGVGGGLEQFLPGLLEKQSKSGLGGDLEQILQGLLAGQSKSGLGGNLGQVLQGLQRQRGESGLDGGMAQVLQGLLGMQSKAAPGRGIGQLLQGLLGQQRNAGLGGGTGQILQRLLGQPGKQRTGGGMGLVVRNLLREQSESGLGGGLGQAFQGPLGRQSNSALGGDLGQTLQGLLGRQGKPGVGGSLGRIVQGILGGQGESGFGGGLGQTLQGLPEGQGNPGLGGGLGRTLQGLLGGQNEAGFVGGRRQGLQGVLRGPVRGFIGFGGERQRLPGFQRGLGGGLGLQRFDTDASERWSGFVPEGAQEVTWNRTLAGRQVAESGWSLNSSDVTLAVIRSRDPRLIEVNFTAAATLYTFRENDTMVTVRPGFRRAGSTCFLLPPSTATFPQTEDKLSARNNTVLGAPTSVVKLNGTGGRLNPSEIADEFRDNPSLLFFCGFSGVVRLSLADDSTFPTSDETDTERVLKMVTMDTELHILVPKMVGNGRFLGNGRLAAAGRLRGLMLPVLRG